VVDRFAAVLAARIPDRRLLALVVGDLGAIDWSTVTSLPVLDELTDTVAAEER
jgi:hypothetical protein